MSIDMRAPPATPAASMEAISKRSKSVDFGYNNDDESMQYEPQEPPNAVSQAAKRRHSEHFKAQPDEYLKKRRHSEPGTMSISKEETSKAFSASDYQSDATVTTEDDHEPHAPCAPCKVLQEAENMANAAVALAALESRMRKAPEVTEQTISAQSLAAEPSAKTASRVAIVPREPVPLASEETLSALPDEIPAVTATELEAAQKVPLLPASEETVSATSIATELPLRKAGRACDSVESASASRQRGNTSRPARCYGNVFVKTASEMTEAPLQLVPYEESVSAKSIHTEPLAKYPTILDAVPRVQMMEKVEERPISALSMRTMSSAVASDEDLSGYATCESRMGAKSSEAQSSEDLLMHGRKTPEPPAKTEMTSPPPEAGFPAEIEKKHEVGAPLLDESKTTMEQLETEPNLAEPARKEIKQVSQMSIIEQPESEVLEIAVAPAAEILSDVTKQSPAEAKAQKEKTSVTTVAKVTPLLAENLLQSQAADENIKAVEAVEEHLMEASVADAAEFAPKLREPAAALTIDKLKPTSKVPQVPIEETKDVEAVSVEKGSELVSEPAVPAPEESKEVAEARLPEQLKPTSEEHKRATGQTKELEAVPLGRVLELVSEPAMPAIEETKAIMKAPVTEHFKPTSEQRKPAAEETKEAEAAPFTKALQLVPEPAMPTEEETKEIAKAPLTDISQKPKPAAEAMKELEAAPLTKGLDIVPAPAVPAVEETNEIAKAPVTDISEEPKPAAEAMKELEAAPLGKGLELVPAPAVPAVEETKEIAKAPVTDISKEPKPAAEALKELEAAPLAKGLELVPAPAVQAVEETKQVAKPPVIDISEEPEPAAEAMKELEATPLAKSLELVSEPALPALEEIKEVAKAPVIEQFKPTSEEPKPAAEETKQLEVAPLAKGLELVSEPAVPAPEETKQVAKAPVVEQLEPTSEEQNPAVEETKELESALLAKGLELVPEPDVPALEERKEVVKAPVTGLSEEPKPAAEAMKEFEAAPLAKKLEVVSEPEVPALEETKEVAKAPVVEQLEPTSEEPKPAVEERNELEAAPLTKGLELVSEPVVPALEETKELSKAPVMEKLESTSEEPEPAAEETKELDAAPLAKGLVFVSEPAVSVLDETKEIPKKPLEAASQPSSEALISVAEETNAITEVPSPGVQKQLSNLPGQQLSDVRSSSVPKPPALAEMKTERSGIADQDQTHGLSEYRFIEHGISEEEQKHGAEVQAVKKGSPGVREIFSAEIKPSFEPVVVKTKRDQESISVTPAADETRFRTDTPRQPVVEPKASEEAATTGKAYETGALIERPQKKVGTPDTAIQQVPSTNIVEHKPWSEEVEILEEPMPTKAAIESTDMSKEPSFEPEDKKQKGPEKVTYIQEKDGVEAEPSKALHELEVHTFIPTEAKPFEENKTGAVSLVVEPVSKKPVDKMDKVPEEVTDLQEKPGVEAEPSKTLPESEVHALIPKEAKPLEEKESEAVSPVVEPLTKIPLMKPADNKDKVPEEVTDVREKPGVEAEPSKALHESEVHALIPKEAKPSEEKEPVAVSPFVEAVSEATIMKLEDKKDKVPEEVTDVQEKPGIEAETSKALHESVHALITKEAKPPEAKKTEAASLSVEAVSKAPLMKPEDKKDNVLEEVTDVEKKPGVEAEPSKTLHESEVNALIPKEAKPPEEKES
ncbi:hypothetical protein MRX96_022375 [Rhipicephalus microplus]